MSSDGGQNEAVSQEKIRLVDAVNPGDLWTAHSHHTRTLTHTHTHAKQISNLDFDAATKKSHRLTLHSRRQ